MTAAPELLHLLGRRGLSLGVAESLTGGALAAEIVSVPGASLVFRGGVVAYATAVKDSLLGVDRALLDEHGPVHPEVALQMAEGARRCLAVDGRAADVGISTTGIAGPESPDGQPVGTVHVGVAARGVSTTRGFRFSGDRAAVRQQAVDAALVTALECLRE